MPKPLTDASNLLNATSIDQVAGGVAFRWSIRTKESECRAGERRWLERGAKRTLVRERRLKVSFARQRGTQCQGGSNEKARSSERACKKTKQARLPVPVAYNLAEEGGIQNRAARASPHRLKPPRDSLKTAHRAVFLARIDLIGSNPPVVVIKQNRHGFPCLQHVTWRRRGDSNPRDPGCGPNGFRDRRIQPLCHPSEGATKKVE